MRSLESSTKNYHSKKFTPVLIPGLLAVTLYFHTKAYDPFNTPKQIILLVLAAWLSGFVIEAYRKTKFSYKKIQSQILVIAGFFLMSLFIGLFYSENFLKGLIGETQRRNGFLTYVSLLIILLYLANYCSSKNVLRIIQVAVITGLLMSIYGLAQINGKDFVRWDNPYNSMISTTGNPNFASALIAVFVVLSLFSVLSGVIVGRFAFINFIMASLGIYVIYKSNSRQGLLVIFFGLVAFLVIRLILEPNVWLKKYRTVILVILLAAVIMVIFGMVNHGPLAKILYKPSVSVRGFYWRAAIEMFQKSPLVGIGLDNYGDYFKQYREIKYPLTHGFEITSTNAHNLFLQFFATGGVLLGFSYLLLACLILFSGLNAIKQHVGHDRKLVTTLLAGWIAFQSQSLISIDNIAISIWGWVLGGLILSFSIGNYPTVERKIHTTEQKSNHIAVFPTVTSIVVLIPTLIISFSLLQAESTALKVRYLLNAKTQNSSNLLQIESRKLFTGNFVDQTYKFEAANALVGIGSVQEGLDVMEKLNIENPRNLDVLKWLATYQNAMGDFESARKYRLLIYKFDPWNLDNYLELGIIEKKLGNPWLAEMYKLKILDLAPDTEISVKAREML